MQKASQLISGPRKVSHHLRGARATPNILPLDAPADLWVPASRIVPNSVTRMYGGRLGKSSQNDFHPSPRPPATTPEPERGSGPECRNHSSNMSLILGYSLSEAVSIHLDISASTVTHVVGGILVVRLVRYVTFPASSSRILQDTKVIAGNERY